MQAVNRFFGIGTNESTTPVRDTGFRVFYELPQDRSMAFIWTADANDIRSEGMSYGMMIALQMDMQDQFDKLWKFARMFMQFPANSATTSWRYNFQRGSPALAGCCAYWELRCLIERLTPSDRFDA